MDFFCRKELIAQTGHQPDVWPLVQLKELVENAVDACEDKDTPPEVTVTVDGQGITVADNGPGITSETVAGMLDFSVRVSSREAYVAPDRGKQGNGLKTIVAMPFVLGGGAGRVEIVAAGVRHVITVGVDELRQKPLIRHEPIRDDSTKNGTTVRVFWPDSASSILAAAKPRFLQFADDYTFLNPHLTLTIDWHGERRRVEATRPCWPKWRPSDPTCAHWYTDGHFSRLVAGYIAADAERGTDRTVREFIEGFSGMSSTAKQSAVLAEVGLKRVNLSALASGSGLDAELVARLLAALKRHTKPVKPARLGTLGRDHLALRFEAIGCEMGSFKYKARRGETAGVPWVQEVAFGHCPAASSRRFIAGVNWSPGIINPFRELGAFGGSLDGLLEELRLGRGEPVALLVHLVCPRVEYADRGKSAVVIGGVSGATIRNGGT
jgi:DNA topoisomerase VI subunit B